MEIGNHEVLSEQVKKKVLQNSQEIGEDVDPKLKQKFSKNTGKFTTHFKEQVDEWEIASVAKAIFEDAIEKEGDFGEKWIIAEILPIKRKG